MIMRRYICMFLAVAALGFVANPHDALAQQSIAVVDVTRLLGDSSAAKNIQTQVKKQQEKFKSALTKKEGSFRDKQKKLVDEKAKLSKEAFAKKRVAFEKELDETRSSIQKNKKALDNGFAVAMRTLEKEIFSIVQKIAAEKKYDLVLTRNNVFLGSTSLDITEEVMRKLNKNLSKVKLVIK